MGLNTKKTLRREKPQRGGSSKSHQRWLSDQRQLPIPFGVLGVLGGSSSKSEHEMEVHLKKFETGEAIRFGWNTVRANLGLFIGLTVIVWALTGGAGSVSRHVPGLGLLTWILGAIVSMGVIRLTLKFVDGGQGGLNDLFSDFSMLLDFLGASFLYTLIVVGGMILLIFPGVIWAIKYGYFGYFIVDRKAGAVEALKLSAAATQGEKGHLFGFGLVLLLLNLLGAACLGVGLLVTYPTSLLAQSYIYRRLQSVPIESPIPPGTP